MDEPKHANAAQMAARKIKSVRPSNRPGARRPVTSSGFAPMSSQNSAPSQNGNGGLFGGSVQAPGTFNFSAPAGNISFPPPTTFNKPEASPEPQEGRWPGDDRGGKRQFGGSSMQQSSSLFQAPNFGQSQQNNPFSPTNPQQPLSGNIFGAASHGTGFGFGSTPLATPAKPPNSPFPFGATSQAAPSSPSISFGTLPGQEKPANNIFNPVPTTQQDKPGSFNFNFGQQPATPSAPTVFGSPAPQQKPASTPFLFGQTSGTTVSAPTPTFGSKPAAEAPKSIFFGTSQTSQSTKPPKTNLFGTNTPPVSQLAQSPAQSSVMFGTAQKPLPANPFAHLNAPASPATNPSENRAQSPVPTSNLFGGLQSQQKLPATSTLFSSTSASQSQQQTPATSNFLGKPAVSQNQQTPSTGNLFGNLGASQSTQQTPATNSLFGKPSVSQDQQQLPASANVGSTASQSTPSTNSSNLFGQQNTQPAPSNNLIGSLNSKPSIGDPFSNLNKPVTGNGNLFNSQSSQPSSLSSTLGTQEKNSSAPKDLFNSTLNKPVDESVMQPKINGNIFKTPEAQKSSSSNLFAQSQPLSSAPPTQSATPSSKPSFLFGSSQPSSQTSTAPSPLKPIDAPSSANHPPPNGMFPSLNQPRESQQQLNQVSGRPVNIYAPQNTTSRTAAELCSVTQIKDEDIAPLVPANYDAKMRAEFYAAYRLRALNEKMGSLFKQINVFADPTPAIQFYQEERRIILSMFEESSGGLRPPGNDEDRGNETPRQITMGPTSTNSPAKRKTRDEDEDSENPSKRSKQFGLPSHSSLDGPVQSSQSSVNGQSQPNQPLATSPSKPLQNGNTSQLSTHPELTQPAIASILQSPEKMKRKAEEDLDKDTPQLNPLRQIKTPKLNGNSTPSNASGSRTSNAFMNILESPGKKIALSATGKESTPSFNPFAKLPGTPSPAKPAASPSSFSFTPKAAPPSAPSPAKATSPVNPFQVKHTQAAATSSTAPVFTPKGVNPTGNFLAQFGASASKTKEDAAKKRLEEALEDYDSEDGLTKEEYIAEFKAKDAARQKEFEELAKSSKSKQAKFEPGKGFGFTSTGKSTSSSKENAKDVDTESNTLFGQSTSQGSGNSAFSSFNNSRTSTPGLVGSASGSVFDGHSSGKPLGAVNNIFGHLASNVDGKDEADEEDDTSDAGDADAEGDIDEDAENKEPSYATGTTTSRSGSGTPEEETGPGVSSAKSNPFSLSGSLSGTSTPSFFGKELKTADDQPGSGASTPGRSLFDRILKDKDGNPVRQIPSEEKENTQPNTTNVFANMANPFASLNKSPGKDLTWKPDSPIKFGSPSNDSAPTVNVTAATPTKTGSPSDIFGGLNPSGSNPSAFSGLFGNKTDVKPATDAPFSILFGNSGTSKPASTNVGFPFGGSSTPSSLFPSAAGSATTSRATSPGATTDGETSADADPDAEKHEQINLTAGGAGEEDEDIIHEVRAKARFWVDNDWAIKGLGPLRILKHKETRATRIVMRIDPAGTVLLNKSILDNPYVAEGKNVKITAASDDGKGLETWLLQVKTQEVAEKLAEVLKENKAS